MKELQKKQKIRRIMYSIPSLILLSIIAFLLAKGAVGVMDKKRDSSELSRNLSEEAVALTLREQQLKEEVARLQTEEGVEDEIRERFSVTQEGEFVAVIVDSRNVSTSTDTSMLPWYKRLWNVIMRVK
ncbi:MAG: septum formation initiator family protein [Candidatus Zambryskibacteria bacterium]|nr:septum formation initiator family protein [Candidatus Zambryskibacteria bacterium]